MLGDIMPASCSKRQNVLHKSIKIQSVIPHGGKEHRIAAAWNHIKTVPLKCNCKNIATKRGGADIKNYRIKSKKKRRKGGAREGTEGGEESQWHNSVYKIKAIMFLVPRHSICRLIYTFIRPWQPPSSSGGIINGCVVDRSNNDVCTNTWPCSLPQGSWSFSRMVTWTSWSTNGGPRTASVTCTPQWTQSRKEVPWT